MEEKPDMPYDFVQSWDFLFNPLKLYDFISRLEIICGKCHTKKSIKFLKKFLTVKCHCGIGILYPPRDDRGGKFLWVWKRNEER